MSSFLLYRAYQISTHPANAGYRIIAHNERHSSLTGSFVHAVDLIGHRRNYGRNG
jgi:hypothetical protein